MSGFKLILCANIKSMDSYASKQTRTGESGVLAGGSVVVNYIGEKRR